MDMKQSWLLADFDYREDHAFIYLPSSAYTLKIAARNSLHYNPILNKLKEN